MDFAASAASKSAALATASADKSGALWDAHKGKRKRNRFGMYKRSDYKKAFVSISKDSEIQFEGIN